MHIMAEIRGRGFENRLDIMNGGNPFRAWDLYFEPSGTLMLSIKTIIVF